MQTLTNWGIDSADSVEQETWVAINKAYDGDPKFEHMRIRRFDIRLVPGRGSLDPYGVMFVGEAPGENENRTGTPFIGAAGKIWEELLESILKLKRSDVYITNVVKYRPMNPENRDPTPYEIHSSLPYLTQEINLLQPKVIVPLGRIATRAFYPGVQAKMLRGKVLSRNGRLVIPTYHPAAITYNRNLKPALITQFEEIASVIS